MRIGIDLMGGDSPPELLFPAVIKAAEQIGLPHVLFVIATKAVIDQLSSFSTTHQITANSASISFHVVADSIAMADEPLGAVRRKRGSSMVVGMRLLKKRQLDAFVSCGNTGALIASATLSLPRFPGIKRPALLASLPTEKGSVAVLDVGGSVSCKAINLIQFALLGVAYQHVVNGIAIPSIGLLNVGVESTKGTTEVRQAYESLKSISDSSQSPSMMKFSGNVEGRDVFKGVVDVLVTDGFTGNVLLKTAEGIAAFIFGSLENVLENNALKDLQKQFNYTEYPGAILCGVDAVVIKVHGNASSKALFKSIMWAAHCVEKQLISQIRLQM